MANSDYILDDQALGAFVDGLLDTAHCDTIVSTMEADPEIRERVYQLRRAKDLMQLGFAEAIAPSKNTARVKASRWNIFSQKIAASLAAVAISFGAGALSYQHYADQSDTASSIVAAATVQQANRVILHISEPDPAQFGNVLAYMNKFLDEHADAAESGQIEVVANAGGINFMRGPISPFKNQIIAMMDEHKNVQFINDHKGC